jgi:hypothetical protein
MGVWLEGEKGGVVPPGTSKDVDILGSALGAVSEDGGEGGRATAGGCAGVVITGGGGGGGAAALALFSDVSMLVSSVL